MQQLQAIDATVRIDASGGGSIGGMSGAAKAVADERQRQLANEIEGLKAITHDLIPAPRLAELSQCIVALRRSEADFELHAR